MIIDEFWSLDKEYFYLALRKFKEDGLRLCSMSRYHNCEPFDTLGFVDVTDEKKHYYMVFEPYEHVILYEGNDIEQARGVINR